MASTDKSLSNHPPAPAANQGSLTPKNDQSVDERSIQDKLAAPEGFTGSSPNKDSGLETNPDVVVVGTDNAGALVGSSSLVKKGPFPGKGKDVIEEEQIRRAAQLKPMKAMSAEERRTAPKSQYRVTHGTVRFGGLLKPSEGDTHVALEAKEGQVIEIDDEEAAHLLSVGAITPVSKV